MNNKIAVIAGTPIDTAFGKKFLETCTTQKVLSFAVSKTPKEQSSLQINNPEKLLTICVNKCLEFKNKGIQKVLIYCNSLSSAINIQKLKEKSGIDIITPLEVYATIENTYKNILIIAANSVGTISPEKIISQKNPCADITTLGYLKLVNYIESNITPTEIFEKSGLKNIVGFAENIGIDLIVLACTHFPYISETLQKNTTIDILDLNNGIQKIIDR